MHQPYLRLPLTSVMTLSTFVLAGCSSQPFPKTGFENATNFVIALSKGEYDEAHEMLSESYKEEMTPAALELMWSVQVQKSGEFKEIYEIQGGGDSEGAAVGVFCTFERDTVMITAIVLADGLIDHVDSVEFPAGTLGN